MARKPKAEAEAPETRPETRPEAGAVEGDVMAVVEATEPEPVAAGPAAEAADTGPPAPEERSAAPNTAQPTAQRGSAAGSFFGMVLGGALVFAAGFGVARYMPDVLPALGTAPAIDTSAIEARLAAMEGRLDAIPAPDGGLADRIAALEAAPQADTAALDQRLADLEARVAQGGSGGGVDPAALDALRAEVAALKSGGPAAAQADALAAEAEARLATVQKAADELRAETEAAAAATRRAAALTRLSAALESGAPFAAALADLGGDVPPVLANAAQSGLPTLASLQDSFPQAARQALDTAIQADMGAGWTERVGNFLRVQTGARSLEPREGGDPDAILSRAEAAVNAGNLTAALAEIATLPAPVQDAMADWTAAATARVQAGDAIATLAAQG